VGARNEQDTPAELEEEIVGLAQPLRGERDLDPLLDRIGDARFVLLGEASHGTADYYLWRAAITRRLIAERGFSFVAVEGDWPDCFEVNCWLKGRFAPTSSATDVLGRFERWPTWMWANREVAEFAEWLRRHNDDDGAEVGFYGLDVYSLWESLERVLGYLADNEPAAVGPALRAMRCFEPYGGDPQRYAFASTLLPSTCEEAVIELLSDLRARARVDGPAPEADFDAVQNAEVLAGAERYYRAMVRADDESWNVRDCHMADTLDRLVTYHGRGAKAIVWAHNTHVGDARATDMAAHGMVNLGQVLRERHGGEGVVLVGFGGHEGTVVAASRWGAPMQRLQVPPAVEGSHEALIDTATTGSSLFVFPAERATPWLGTTRDHRAIGVVYDPRRDRYGNWVPTVLGERYDAFLSFGRTDALHPLHGERVSPGGEKQTFPWNT